MDGASCRMPGVPGWSLCLLLHPWRSKSVIRERMDGGPLRSTWSEAFTKLLEIGKPFICDDIIKNINPDLFLLHEGWDLPITFCGSTTLTLTAPMSQMVVAAFQVEGKPDSLSIKQLIKYLDMAPVPIAVLVVLPFSESSTLLLLRIPTALQELLVFILPQIVLRLINSES